MCVIAFSPKGKDIPSVEQLTSMWYTNPDGAGYAYVGKDGRVVYRKGFMTLDSLLEELKNPERFKNTNFAVHFRIGTAGQNDAPTCHPFPVSTEFGRLRQTEGVEDAVLFHNGVIGTGGLVNPLSSDTQDLVVALAPMIQKYNKSKARDHYISQFTSGNRLLILYKNNAFKMYGGWERDGDLWVSNLHYKGYYSWEGARYGDSYYDDDYSWYEEYYAKKNKEDTTIDTSDPIIQSIVDEVVKKEYAFVTKAEMDAIKRSATDYTIDEIYIGGYTFGYDNSQLLLWLEKDNLSEKGEQ